MLVSLARRRGASDELAALIAGHVQRVTVGAGLDVTVDACEALLRRLVSSRDVVVKRARDGYRAGTRGKAGSDYAVWLAEPARLVGSCDCADFGKASLGLCKHLLALAGRRLRASSPRAVRWDPVRPLGGAGDRLARLWHDSRVRLPSRVAALFQAAPAARPIEPAMLAGDARRATLEILIAACRRDPCLAEPAVLPFLVAEHATTVRGLAVSARELDRLLRGLKQKLFAYQRAGVLRFLATGRLLLADDMGLGKTAQAIAGCHALVAAKQITRALIVAPASLKPQWLREWQAFTDLEIAMVDGPPDVRARMYRRPGPAILLVNYEQLLRDLPHVQRFAPELVVLDEAQRIKNWETRTASVVKELEPAWRLVLTGTPMENRLDELSSIMEWVDEYALEPRWRLPSWHSVRGDGEREVIGARNLDTLRVRLAPAMLRRVREDVLAQLPPRRDTRIPVLLTPAQQDAHADLDQPIARIVAQSARRALTQPEFLKLMTLLAQQRMICNALALRDFARTWPQLEANHHPTDALISSLGSPKLEDLRERLVELAVTQRRKVVVFSQWRRMLQLASWTCRDRLGTAGVRSVFFTGQESQRRRTENLIAFHDDPATRVLFASDAGGVGLNLQRAASCCINLEMPWNPAVLEQRVGRVYRFGQTSPVEVYNYVAMGGIEERIAHLVGDKRALFKGLFDGTSDEVPFERGSSFLARVGQVLPAASVVQPGIEDAEDAREAVEADDAPEAPATRSDPQPLAPVFPDLATLLAEFRPRPRADGRVAIEISAQAATALGGLLRGLAAAVEGLPRS